MFSKKANLQVILGIALCTLGISGALADYEPNDSYSTLILSYQSSTFATPVCIGIECHEGLSGPAVVYARQLIPNLALGLSGSYLQSVGSSSSIKSTTGSVFVQGIAGLGRRVDIGASVAALSTTLELCASNPSVCASTPDRGTDIGVFGKVFLNDMRSVTAGLGFNYIAMQKSSNLSIVTLSLVTILAKHHRLALSVDRVRESDTNSMSGGYGFGYSYLIF